MTRRVVITGIGLVAPTATDKERFFDACMAGRASVAPIPDQWRRFTDFTSRIWAPLPEVAYSSKEMTRIEQKQLDPVAKNSIHTAFRALDDADIQKRPADEKRRTYRIDTVSPERAGVFIGTGVGGIQTIAGSHAHQLVAPVSGRIDDDVRADLIFPKRFNPFTVPMLMPNASAANIAIKLGLTGPNLTLALACASGTAAVGHCFRAIKHGYLDLGLAGGSEYLFDPVGTVFRGFDAVKTLVHGDLPNDEANRPFDEARSGFLFSQGGAAVLVIETLENAIARGADPIAEIVGYAETCDASSIMTMDRSGEQIARMVTMLHNAADIDPREIDYVNTHGTGTQLNDEVEASLIARLFRNDVIVNSTKALIGHTIGAAGAIEAAVTALAVSRGRVHGMPNLHRPIRDLNFARQSVAAPIDAAVSLSFAFGGHNAALLLKRV